MKKLLIILIVCVLCICCAFGFTACDFGSQQNSGSEITDEQSKGEENNNEEKIVITKDTDFDAFESDKVEKDVFIDAFVLGAFATPYIAADINFTYYSEVVSQNQSMFGTVKIDGLKRFVSESAAGGHDAYLILAGDFKSYIIGGIVEGEVRFMEGRAGDIFIPNIEENNKFAAKAWNNATYNEESKQYEISQIEGGYSFLDSGDRPSYIGNNTVYSDVRIKIKDGNMVYLEYTDDNGYVWCYKFYDIGTTVVEIPDELMAAINAKK